ncbi:hypothetical protein FOZ62_028939, partial [Perkinsus olseni]
YRDVSDWLAWTQVDNELTKVLTSHCTSVRERVRDNMNSLTAEYFRSSVDGTDRKLWALRIEETKAAKNCLKLVRSTKR